MILKNKALSLDEILNRKPTNSRLTPIDFGQPYLSPGGHRRRTLLCDCDCGNQHTTDITYFMSGKVLSCGCYNVDKSQKMALTIDEINNRLPKRSRLIAIKYVGNYRMPSGQQQRQYLFLCNCGKE